MHCRACNSGIRVLGIPPGVLAGLAGVLRGVPPGVPLGVFAVGI